MTRGASLHPASCSSGYRNGLASGVMVVRNGVLSEVPLLSIYRLSIKDLLRDYKFFQGCKPRVIVLTRRVTMSSFRLPDLP